MTHAVRRVARGIEDLFLLLGEEKFRIRISAKKSCSKFFKFHGSVKYIFILLGYNMERFLKNFWGNVLTFSENWNF